MLIKKYAPLRTRQKYLDAEKRRVAAVRLHAQRKLDMKKQEEDRLQRKESLRQQAERQDWPLPRQKKAKVTEIAEPLQFVPPYARIAMHCSSSSKRQTVITEHLHAWTVTQRGEECIEWTVGPDVTYQTLTSVVNALQEDGCTVCALIHLELVYGQIQPGKAKAKWYVKMMPKPGNSGLFDSFKHVKLPLALLR
jgi:hypothetical protein